MHNLKDKTIVLTGAVGGIGQAVAELLHASGAALVLTDINAESLEQLNKGFNNKHYTVAADLAVAEDRRKLVNCCSEMLTPPEMLINIAGLNLFALLTDHSDEQLTKLVSVNLISQIALCRDFLPLFSKLPAATIVNVGSILGSIGMPGYSVYCASKFGLRGFSEAITRELMDSAIEVRYFAPRATQTALNDSRANEMNQALGNSMDTPQHVAKELVEFLQHDKKRTYLGWPEKLFVRINSLFPSLVDKSFQKQLTVIKSYL